MKAMHRDDIQLMPATSDCIDLCYRASPLLVALERGSCHPKPRREESSAKLLLIQEFDAEDAVLVAGCHRRPMWVYGPFDANSLTVRIVQRGYVSEGNVAGNLLLQREPSLR